MKYKTETIHIRVDKELKKEIDKLSKELGRTSSDLVRWILEMCLKK